MNIKELEKRCNELFFQVNEKTERIADLEKENAELKRLKRECETSLCRAEYQYNYEQLTKAKDMIEILLSDNRIMKAQFESEEQANIWFEHIHQAEQFLNSEVGK